MKRRILIIQGHPDPRGRHFGHALADAYGLAASTAGHDVRCLEVAALDFALLRNSADWHAAAPAAVAHAQATIAWAEHLVLFFPLWLGTMPAVLKAFLEQVLRPGFALIDEGGRFPRRGLAGKSARVVVTMGCRPFGIDCFFAPTASARSSVASLGFAA